ncbi:MAG: ATP-binding protein [Bryobacteraceae bacterium]
MRYLQRTLEDVLARAARAFPAILLTGPRQSGKTTLLLRKFGRTHRYVSVEPPDIRAAATADPRGFLDLYPPPAIYDEVQCVPALLPYIKEMIDARRHVPGQFFLTGSENLLLSRHVTETLAGRAAILRLLPLTAREMTHRSAAPFPWERAKSQPPAPLSRSSLWKMLLRGSYPEPASHSKRDAVLWYGSYLHTYLERDVRSLKQIGDLTQFQIFLRALAIRSAQLLNLSELSRDLGIAVNTVKAWLSVLEATDQILILRPYFENTGKRLVKTPKVYFTDTGMLCHLAGLRAPEHARSGPMGGAIFETAVVSEIYRATLHRGDDPKLFFWRTAAGDEVDLIVDAGGTLIPIEIKATATPNPRMAHGIESFRAAYGNRVAKGYVVHTGGVTLPLAPGVTALPFTSLF